MKKLKTLKRSVSQKVLNLRNIADGKKPVTPIWLLLTFALLTAPLSGRAKSAAEMGKEYYEANCVACHSVNENRIGPMHLGVFKRKAGSVAGYDYSKQLKSSEIVWDEERLDQWLTNPRKLVKGAAMGFRVDDPENRKNVIEYLKTLK